MRAVERSFPSEDTPIRQLFVTRSRVLALHVEASFRELTKPTETLCETDAGHGAKDTLLDFDDEADLRSALPPKFSLLEDSHFPLFVSFDQLCSLLEGDLAAQAEADYKKSVRRSMIGFSEFCEMYWPKFKGHLTSVADPAQVYSEILGVIKGSFEALQSTDGYLSRTQYTERFRQQAPLQSTRLTPDIIYSIFEQYQSLKGQHFDQVDRTRHIIKYLQPEGVSYPVDYLYVANAQDHSMIDIHLLRSLCRDIRGTYWSCDIVQPVVTGSAFRIKHLQSLIYKNIRDDPQTTTSTLSSLLSTFYLTVNFRSHGGIVNCATSILEDLYRLFPDSVDRMPPETAMINGPPPVFITDSKNDPSFFGKFILDSGIGLDAILVRSDAVAEELKANLNGWFVVLPIIECK
ncbi:hypothetical protein FRC06_007061, partial [Ceratobasidium sp. 370]